MSAQVYFLKLNQPSDCLLEEAGRKIFQTFGDFFGASDRVAVKLHFGERASTTRLSPFLVKGIYAKLRPVVADAALMDCNVLYKGERSFGASHKKLALDNGFDFAPIVIADGEKGDEETIVPINGRYFKEIKLGRALENYNAILAVSHFTGHGSSGMGAAIKNIGMGLGSKAGKLAMHQSGTFGAKIDSAKCQGCGLCLMECPAHAIILENNKAVIDYRKCLNCGRCISECNFGAASWIGGSSKELQEKIAEYAWGALRGRKSFFINVLLGITARCDCVRDRQEPVMGDIGLLASNDIVAVDQASLDLAQGRGLVKLGVKLMRFTGLDPRIQINRAAELGLGQKKYRITELAG
ncbi:MAG: DUF362 domain-containing protein [Candidatus Pacebacteria bacterium]|nr:DUF362 domain-containing protein [Candidatus Paceibacterota bacterium]